MCRTHFSKALEGMNIALNNERPKSGMQALTLACRARSRRAPRAGRTVRRDGSTVHPERREALLGGVYLFGMSSRALGHDETVRGKDVRLEIRRVPARRRPR